MVPQSQSWLLFMFVATQTLSLCWTDKWHVLFYGDYGRAEILSCVSTVFVLIPMYHFIRVSRHFPSIDVNEGTHSCIIEVLGAMYKPTKYCELWR